MGGGASLEMSQDPAGIFRGVRLRAVQKFLAERCPRPDMTTTEVVEEVIKPLTASRMCRFAAILEEEEPGSTGRAKIFVSHTWRAEFRDLVAALSHLCSAETIVWIDIYAVLQHEAPEGSELAAEKKADLDFRSIVRSSDGFVLVGKHLQEVADMTEDDINRGFIPAIALDQCAFYRVWCLVELSEALESRKSVVMMVGRADEAGGFVPNDAMADPLAETIDVTMAAASREEDRLRILAEIDAGLGIEAINKLAIGATNGLHYHNRAVLRAVLGDLSDLSRLTKKHELREALVAAAASGYIAPLQILLKKVKDVNFKVKDAYNFSPLTVAAEGGHADSVSMLLAAGASPNLKDEDKQTPLHAAARSGDAETVRRLVAAKANLEHKDNEGITPLYSACQYRMAESVEMLIALGAHANTNCVLRKSAGKRFAAKLLKSGKSHEAENHTALNGLRDNCFSVMDTTQQIANSRLRIESALGVPPLHVAVGAADLVKVEQLIQEGADVEAVDAMGMNPLEIARESPIPLAPPDATVLPGYAHRPQMLKWAKQLYQIELRLGVPKVLVAIQSGEVTVVRDCINIDKSVVHTIDALGTSALMLAAQECVRQNGRTQTSFEMLQMLLAGGADPKYASPEDRFTALHVVCNGDVSHAPAVRALLAARADVDAPAKDGCTPLMCAASGGLDGRNDATREEDVGLQLGMAGDTNDKDERGVVQVLLAAGASVHITTESDRMTALHYAASEGGNCPDTIEALVAAGANVNARDSTKLTPLMLAAEDGAHGSCAALVRLGADVDLRNDDDESAVELAFDHPASVRKKTLLALGEHALVVASGVGDIDEVKAQIAAGANVNVRGLDNETTPLIQAVTFEEAEIAELLIAAGADVNAKADGETPLDICHELDDSAAADRIERALRSATMPLVEKTKTSSVCSVL